MKAISLALAVVVWACGLATARALPVPPIPPKTVPTLDAPLPDLNIQIPYDGSARPTVTLDMSIHRRAAPDPSLGYGPGARYRIDNDRRLLAVPGVLFRVPLP